MDLFQVLIFCITVTVAASKRNPVLPKWDSWYQPSRCYSSNCSANGVARVFKFRWCLFGKEKGAMCQGNSIAVAGTCFEGANCPIDGQWSSWSAWKCNLAEKIATRERECDNPPPKNGGKKCNEARSTEILEKEADEIRFRSICKPVVILPIDDDDDDEDGSGSGSGDDDWDKNGINEDEEEDPW